MAKSKWHPLLHVPFAVLWQSLPIASSIAIVATTHTLIACLLGKKPTLSYAPTANLVQRPPLRFAKP
jgi:hypothetical protein